MSPQRCIRHRQTVWPCSSARWRLLGLIMALAGCATTLVAQPAPRATLQTTPAASPVPSAAPTAIPASAAVPAPATDPSGWHMIYRRPGFIGQGSIDLRAVGDIMLARNVEHLLRVQPDTWLLEPTAELLGGDIVVGNLESPFTDRRRPEQLRPGPYRLPADPRFVATLRAFTALSLANNHALDAGPEGLTDSWRTLQSAGIAPLGVRNGACAGDQTSLFTGEPSIHLVAFNAVRDPGDRPDEAEGCGRSWLDAAALTEIRELNSSSSAPIVVLVHWGDEYAATPSREQRQWAADLVGAGADLVLGAHPHVLQPAEPVESAGRRGFVAYSLGNFVFDQPQSPETSSSVVLRAWLDADGVGAVAVAPVAIRSGRPEPLGPDEAHAATAIDAIAPRQAEIKAWRWNGSTFVPTPVPAGTVLPPPPAEWSVDLRGDGQPLRVTLTDGRAQVHDGERVVWHNEAEDWYVAGVTTGDADNDGRFEALLRLWKPDAAGVTQSHPFMVGWRGGYYRVFWGGSAVARPIQDAAIGRVNGSGNALVVLEGGEQRGDTATHVGVWTWQDWTFAEQWQSEPGSYHRLALLDLDGDGMREIVVE